MIFRSATTKSVKADFSKGEITLTFTVPFDEDERDTASALAKYVDADAGDVRLEITPRQMAMLDRRVEIKSFTGSEYPAHLVKLAARIEALPPTARAAIDEVLGALQNQDGDDD